MRLGRLFFAGAVLLGLGWAALRSPLPAVDPRFLKEDVADAGAPLSFSVYLDAGYSRDRAKAELAAATAPFRKFALEASADPAALAVERAELLESAAAQLKAAGVANLMIRFGGHLVVRGRRGNAPWRIGLRNPRGGPDDAVAYLLADRDEAVATFGDRPVITVLDADGPSAAANAATLAGAGREWPKLARQQALAQVMSVDAEGTVTVTPELNQRLKFLHGITPRVLPQT
jgi:hypothetical protein